MRKALSIALVAAATAAVSLLSTSCKKTIPTLTVTPTAVSIDVAGGAKTLSVASNVAWTATSSQSWLKISPAAGEGEGAITVTAEANTGFDARTADVTVKTETLTETAKITQIGLTPTISALPETVSATAEGGKFTIDVVSNTNWTLMVPGASDWCQPDIAKGSGSGKVVLTITANKVTSARSVELTFTETTSNKTAKVAVSQEALSPKLVIDPKSISAKALSGTYKIAVTCNVAWKASTSSDFLTIDKTSGDGNGEVTVTVNEHKELRTRTGSIVFTETVTNKSDSTVVTQAEAAASRYTDSLALVEIYNASKGATWTKENWDLTQPMTEWKGIRINAENRVDSIRINQGVVTAQNWNIPEHIGDLSELKSLTFYKDMVNGSLPESLYDLAKLEKLDLSSNDITGGFSSKLGQLSNLTYISLINNVSFGGTLPKEIGALKNLYYLNMNNTGLTGSIPAEIKGCTAMQMFMVFGNKMDGEVPDVWDSFAHLSIVQLYGNGFTGSLPASFGNVKTDGKVLSLHLYNCNFTGNIPESYANLPAVCKQLRVQGNRLSGTVPAAVKAHANWTVWKAADYIFPQQEGYGLN
jgi:hypothetical protein